MCLTSGVITRHMAPPLSPQITGVSSKNETGLCGHQIIWVAVGSWQTAFISHSQNIILRMLRNPLERCSLHTLDHCMHVVGKPPQPANFPLHTSVCLLGYPNHTPQSGPAAYCPPSSHRQHGKLHTSRVGDENGTWNRQTHL